jgi:hypothetical protein
LGELLADELLADELLAGELPLYLRNDSLRTEWNVILQNFERKQVFDSMFKTI